MKIGDGTDANNARIRELIGESRRSQDAEGVSP
jgi:hypothetical protein